MTNNRNTIRIISEIGMLAALGFVFDELQGILSKGIFINGGSIGFAMIAVLFMAYRRGLVPALLTGLVMGFLDVATSAYIIHPAQLILDYILPYALVGLTGLFKPFFDHSEAKTQRITWLIIGTLVGGVFKFASHYLAGIIFWSDPTYFAWDLNNMNVYLYCFIYNAAFIGPSIVITAPLLVTLFAAAPRIFTVQKGDLPVEEKSANTLSLVYSIGTSIVGAFFFVYFLVLYILSFTNGSGTGYIDYEFNSDYLTLFILGLFALIVGILSTYRTFKNNYSGLLLSGVWGVILLTSFIYSLARLIRMYVKTLDPTIYWVWLAISLVSLSLVVFLFIKKLRNINK